MSDIERELAEIRERNSDWASPAIKMLVASKPQCMEDRRWLLRIVDDLRAELARLREALKSEGADNCECSACQWAFHGRQPDAEPKTT